MVSKVGPANDPNITYLYDIAGRVVDVNDSGEITHYTYDRLGRVTQVEDTQNRLVDYEYDSLSRRTKLVYPDDSFITYEYDALSRLTKIIDDTNAVVGEYSYDELSRRTQQTLQNDANTVYAYDLANRLTSLDNALSDPNNSTLAFDYTYDNVGNRLTMTVDNAALHSYTYDAIYQLTYADYPSGQGADTAYSYDSVFNRTSVNNGSVTNYTANGLNQYTAVGSANLTYDDNGNLTDDGAYKYYYDCENRLVDVNTIDNVPVASYTYDYHGRRTGKTVGATTTKYCYDGDQVIAEYNGSTLIKKYIYGPGIDEPICMINVSGQNETRYYYHFDGLGSVVALTAEDGTLVEQYHYDVFGVPNTTSTVGNPYMFTGREYDSETGLYYYRARYYKPTIGRFLQTDPIGYSDSMNLYAYVGNNSINFLDPSGLCSTNSKKGYYSYKETERILFELRSYKGQPGLFGTSWNPYMHLVYCNIPMIGGYDFKGSGYTFTIKENGEDVTLKDSEFGNYIAGYGGYYHWGKLGEKGMYWGGEWYARDISDWWKIAGRGDDSDSKRDIARGVRDAKEQMKSENEKAEQLLKNVPWPIKDLIKMGPI